ncbi:MAG: hypothetical protein MI864_12340 [Pseudomonadales bacterium]|nr:hypothetical protein [Pseudomonadales bacterium]
MDIPKDIVRFPENLISLGEEEIRVIKIHHFRNEEELHDDDLIDSAISEFSIALKRLSQDLVEKYGVPNTRDFAVDFDEYDEFIEEEFDDERFCVPGSFVSAVWEREDFTLYLAVCKEDRKHPIVLILGVAY